MAKNQLVEQKETAVVFATEKPAHLMKRENVPVRGMEDVTANDVIIPRLEIVQSLSPARDKTSPQYIPGAEEGMFYNNVTRELYGPEVYVVPVMYKKQWLIWKNRKLAAGASGASGFRGALNSEMEAKAKIAELAKPTQEMPQGDQFLEAVETAQHFCYLVHANGSVSEIVISMAKSKLKVSKRWNSLMRIAETDSFAHVYKVGSVVEANAKGEKFQNIAITSAGYAPEAIYVKAEALHAQISKGGVVVNHDYEAEPEGPSSDGNQDF